MEINWDTIQPGDLVVLDDGSKGGRYILLEFVSNNGNRTSTFQAKVIKSSNSSAWSVGEISTGWSRQLFKKYNGHQTIIKEIISTIKQLEKSYGKN